MCWRFWHTVGASRPPITATSVVQRERSARRSTWTRVSGWPRPRPRAPYDCHAPPEQARRIIDRLEIHHTPKHGSWLNMAEIELSVLARQCLDQRLDSRAKLQQETEAWQLERNEQQVEIKWQFTTADARIKLHRLYPVIQ